MKVIVLLALQSRDKTNHIFSLLVNLPEEINLFHACREECMPVGPFVLVFSASSSKVKFILGSVIRIRGWTMLRWYIFSNNTVAVTSCHRKCTRHMVPFLLILIIVQICLNLNICNYFLYK